jgi:diketogulonate reductase-like aldo/keto reductase
MKNIEIKHIDDTAILHNGVRMPWLGLGVLHITDGEQVENAVRWALEAGYRHIDTATVYGNEVGVGQALKKSGVPRQEIFVTTKVWNSDQGYDNTLAAFEASLQRLKLDYVDLYLVHWPVKDKFNDTWRALETIYDSGRTRAIGVSNFLPHHLETLLETARLVPMVNQVEFHPYLQQPDLQALCRDHQIQLEAWRPIIQGRVNQIPELVGLANKYGKTPVQITLRWMMQRAIVTIPKSEQEDRIQSNADLYDFELEPSDLVVIDGLDRGERFGEDPDNFHFDF